MFKNAKTGRQEINFTTNVPKILDVKSFSETDIFRKLTLGARVDSRPRKRRLRFSVSIREL